MSRVSVLASIALFAVVGCTSSTWQEPMVRGTKSPVLKAPSQTTTPLVANATKPAVSSTSTSEETNDPMKTGLTDLDIEAPTSLDEALDQVIDHLNSDGHVARVQSTVAQPKTAVLAGPRPEEISVADAKPATPKTMQPPRIASLNQRDTIQDVKSVKAPKKTSSTPRGAGSVNPLRSEPGQFR